MAREFELKYAANPGVFNEIRETLGDLEEISMETTYFDTPDAALSLRRITLRSRRENGVCVCTLKTPGVGYGRGEWDAKEPWCAETVAKLWRESGEKSVPFEAWSRPVGQNLFGRQHSWSCPIAPWRWPWIRGYFWEAAGKSPFAR